MAAKERRVRRRSIDTGPPGEQTAAAVGNSHAGARNGTGVAVPSKFQLQHYEGECPLCGGAGKLYVEWNGHGWWVNCRRASCPFGGDYLRAVAALVGAPSGGALKEDPLRYLAGYLGPFLGRRTGVPPEALPSQADPVGWQSRLWSNKDGFGPLNYLHERGLSKDTIRQAQLGYDGAAITIPIRDADGELVNLRRRYWPDVPEGKKYVGLRGRNRSNGGVQLYPRPLPPGGWLLVAGEFDALIGRQYGLPTVSGTLGTAWWSAGWDPLVRGRKVYVMYDVGEEESARSRAAALRHVGADAYPVRLSQALGKGKDLTDWFTSGRTRADLVELIHHERAVARRRRRLGIEPHLSLKSPANRNAEGRGDGKR